MRKCIICEQDIEEDEHELVDYAGFVEVSFHFGSKFDQMKGFSGKPYPAHSNDDEHLKELKQLLNCDLIEGVIHDKCFEAKMKLFRGFNIKKAIKKERVV